MTSSTATVSGAAATLAGGHFGVLTVTVCVQCLDTGTGVTVGGGAKVTLTHGEISIPPAIQSQLDTPLTYDASTGCYKKEVQLKGVIDPHATVGGQKFTINVVDKSGQTVTSSTVTVTEIP